MHSRNNGAIFVSTKGVNNINQITMETTTEKNYTINYEEAWTPNYSVSVDFTFNEVEYHAMGNYYPSNGTEDYELLNLKTNEYVDEDDEVYELGFELICKVDIRKHLTFF